MEMANLLKAKHWQLFSFVYGLPILYIIWFFGYIIYGNIEKNALNTDLIIDYSKYSLLFLATSVLLLLSWFWFVVEGLNSKLTNELRIKTSNLKGLITVLTSYTITISIFIWMIMNSWDHDKILYTSFSKRTYLYIGTMFFILNVFILMCTLFVINLVAKILKTAELKKKVSFDEYIGEFILIWLFPIGVWFIQPRVNSLMRE